MGEQVLPGKKGEDGEADDEDFKLPRCISRELQAHQRVGVRFMWDNTVSKPATLNPRP